MKKLFALLMLFSLCLPTVGCGPDKPKTDTPKAPDTPAPKAPDTPAPKAPDAPADKGK